jgi:hypothetical protein
MGIHRRGRGRFSTAGHRLPEELRKPLSFVPHKDAAYARAGTRAA